MVIVTVAAAPGGAFVLPDLVMEPHVEPTANYAPKVPSAAVEATSRPTFQKSGSYCGCPC